MEGAEAALVAGDVARAFDDYVSIFRSLAVRWPDGIRTEEALDAWFDKLCAASPSLEPPLLSEALSDLLWTRVQLDADDEDRRRELARVARDVARRLADGDALQREARLTEAVLAVTAGAGDGESRAQALCLAFPDDAWIRLEVSRAYGRLRPAERCDAAAARRWAEESLRLGDGETDLYVYEDLTALLQAAGSEAEILAFEKAFWRPDRLEHALRWYGPEPPLGAIEAALRLGAAAIPRLVAVLEDPDVRGSWQRA